MASVNSPRAFNQDPRVRQVRAAADRERRKTLLERERRTSARRDDLRRAQASTRAEAAADGVAGGASAQAVEQGLGRTAARAESFDKAEADLAQEEIAAERDQQLEQIARDRRRNLLDATRERQRASLGIVGQLARREPF